MANGLHGAEQSQGRKPFGQRLSSIFSQSALEERVHDLEAENLLLLEELDRARLALSGAHSSMRTADALAEARVLAETREDEMDDMIAFQLETHSARAELLRLITLFQESLHFYKERLGEDFATETGEVEQLVGSGSHRSGAPNGGDQTSPTPLFTDERDRDGSGVSLDAESAIDLTPLSDIIQVMDASDANNSDANNSDGNGNDWEAVSAPPPPVGR